MADGETGRRSRDVDDETGRSSDDGDSPSVLAVADFTGNPTKVRRHLGPLAAVADPAVVCISTADVEGLERLSVPSAGWRPLGLALMGVRALVAARRGDYDAVVSFSLLPHGCIALAAARLAGLPVHLGTIGADLDVHAEAWYAPVVRALVRRFDVVSAPGSVHVRQLESVGVDAAAVLRNPVDEERFAPPGDDECASDDEPVAPADDATVGSSGTTTVGSGRTTTVGNGGTAAEYDLLWVGRFSAEKDPLLFVRTVAALHERGRPVTAAMVGDGPLADEVRAAVRRRGVGDAVALPGWVDDPSDWYRAARTFVVTSWRDALPLTLLEAMATGVVPVAPPVGNVPDVVVDGETGVLADRNAAALADAVADLLDEDDRRVRLAAAAAAVREEYSMAAAAGDWAAVLELLGVGSGGSGDGPVGGRGGPKASDSGGRRPVGVDSGER